MNNTASDVITSLCSIRDYIRWGASRFAEHQIFLGHGTVTPLDEAAAIVLHTLHQPYDLADSYLDSVLTLSERQEVVNLIERRIVERKPSAYLTHEALFAGLSFYVDERVLVPRSPIAELIAERFEPWVDESEVFNILDLCTGSACIAIACAYAFRMHKSMPSIYPKTHWPLRQSMSKSMTWSNKSRCINPICSIRFPQSPMTSSSVIHRMSHWPNGRACPQNSMPNRRWASRVGKMAWIW